MTEEKVFEGYVRVMTNGFGFSNDPNDATLMYETEGLSSNKARMLLMDNTKIVSSGNASFLVGTPYMPWNQVVYQIGLDVDLIPQNPEKLSFEVWIPMHEIISIIPSPPSP